MKGNSHASIAIAMRAKPSRGELLRGRAGELCDTAKTFPGYLSSYIRIRVAGGTQEVIVGLSFRPARDLAVWEQRWAYRPHISCATWCGGAADPTGPAGRGDGPGARMAVPCATTCQDGGSVLAAAPVKMIPPVLVPPASPGPSRGERMSYSIQLYTLRTPLELDLPGTIERVAEIGFTQVEPTISRPPPRNSGRR
jgi:hypothetical protein